MSNSIFKIRLKKGDTVMIRAGKYKGKTGKVTVEGINIVKRHRKPTQARPQGGIEEITKPIWVSKVGVLDSTAKKPSRISYKFDKDGKKARVMKTSGKEIK
jgi:large subunit ribosomal protein L24